MKDNIFASKWQFMWKTNLKTQLQIVKMIQIQSDSDSWTQQKSLKKKEIKLIKYKYKIN